MILMNINHNLMIFGGSKVGTYVSMLGGLVDMSGTGV
jgi:hypothetical protein